MLQETEDRESSFELLRIVSMLLIICSHYATNVFNNVIPIDASFQLNTLFLQIMSLGGGVGVALFVLISGYFGINFNPHKLLGMWGNVIFYSLLFLLLAFLSDTNLTMSLFVMSVLPISTGLYWFMTSYFVLYILSPFINKALDSLSQKQYILLLLAMISINSVIPYIVQSRALAFANSGLLITFYILGRFMSKYRNASIFKTRQKAIFMILFAHIFMFVYFYIADFVFTSLPPRFFFRHSSPVTLLAAFGIFILFMNLHLKNYKLISYFASTTLAVYLIHANPFVSIWIFNRIFNANEYIHSSVLIPFSVLAVAVIYIGCVFIEKTRIALFSRFDPLKKIVFNKIINYFDFFINTLLKIFEAKKY